MLPQLHMQRDNTTPLPYDGQFVGSAVYTCTYTITFKHSHAEVLHMWPVVCASLALRYNSILW